ncbi:hypothetical protein EJF36_13070 [Bacillus sp. HMF5848]|uniref:iron-sulfur cluster biosynthesis family protein n=1 Tax=Bacillus sp. HMF5848 TaxID=2495421 RepID=UPI000F77986F|nr:iron-sulfur cluster biosynthesis family protein [Bacillus sp. HMF5848]RSK27730.1 hypothetical protein EJF36_13070 [Bacillus sp. HMF5848]
MIVTFTEKAISAIKNRYNMSSDTACLQLFYDIEGCGCGVNGVPVFKEIKEPGSNIIQITSNWGRIYLHTQQAVFFPENMIVDYYEKSSHLQLKSKEEMVNPHIQIEKYKQEDQYEK